MEAGPSKESDLLQESVLMEHFCQLIDNDDKLIDDQNLFCIKCLEQHKTSAFANKTPHDILMQHLVTDHQIKLNPNEQDELLPYKPPIDKTNLVWTYFSGRQDVKGQFFCNICTSNGVNSTFAEGINISLLKRHLSFVHKIVLPRGRQREANTEEPDIYEPPPRKFTRVNKSSVWKFYCKTTKKGQILKDGYVYCGECLRQQIKKRYKERTSTGTLAQHLQVHHGIIFDENWNGVADSKTRRHFTKLDNEPNNLYCRLCLEKEHRQRYSTSSSTSTLRHHLKSKHGLDVETETSDKVLTEDEAELDNLSDTLDHLDSFEGVEAVEACSVCMIPRLGYGDQIRGRPRRDTA